VGTDAMKRADYTDMGGTGEAFLTTHWSLVEGVASADEDHRRTLIALLLDRYWKPVYCYLRRKGYSNEEAKDLTQGFFHEVVLQRHLVEKADPAKGRFRSFLLMALNRYLANEQKHAGRQRRTPQGKLIPLEVVEPPELSHLAVQAEPEDCFNYAWVSALLERVLVDLEANCHRDGQTVHWHLFHDRVLAPIMDRTDPISLAEVCARYGIEDESKASNMIVTVKRRFQKLLTEHLRKSVVSDALLAEELEEIKRFFPKIAQENG
jgi:DNA-directed RNA polymerase specialized sigma24 family protein